MDEYVEIYGQRVKFFRNGELVDVGWLTKYAAVEGLFEKPKLVKREIDGWMYIFDYKTGEAYGRYLVQKEAEDG